MGNFNFYLLVIFLIVYIISPLDFFPGFLDDLFASGILWYQWRKRRMQNRQKDYYSQSTSQEGKRDKHRETTSVEEAYRLLDTNPTTSWEEVHKAYKEKMMKSHPDKVAHLGEELQEKAKEVTMKLNKAIKIIRQHKKV